MKKIKVIGIGGGAIKAVGCMIEAGMPNAEFYAVDSDSLLKNSKAENKIQIGKAGVSCAGDIQKGKQCVNESIKEIKEMISEAEILILVACMGAGTATGAISVISKLAKEAGIFTLAVLTKPHSSESKTRIENADKGINELNQYIDKSIIIDYNKIIDDKTDLTNGFKSADKFLTNIVNALVSFNFLDSQDLLSIDCNDLKRFFENSVKTVFCSGEAETVMEAFKKAINSITSEDIKKLLIAVSDSAESKFTVGDFKNIEEYIKTNIPKAESLKIGTVKIQNKEENKCRVLVIAGK